MSIRMALLAGAALGTLAMASQAQALTISYKSGFGGQMAPSGNRIGADNGNLTASGAGQSAGTGASGGVYKLASESRAFGTANGGQQAYLSIQLALSNNASIPSGNSDLTITVGGATIPAGAFLAQNVNEQGCATGTFTVATTNLGTNTNNASRQSFVISNTSTCNSGIVTFDVPITLPSTPPAAGSFITVQAQLQTDGSANPIDSTANGVAMNAVFVAPAFEPVIRADSGITWALISPTASQSLSTAPVSNVAPFAAQPFYRTLTSSTTLPAGDGILGDVALLADDGTETTYNGFNPAPVAGSGSFFSFPTTASHYDLNPGHNVSGGSTQVTASSYAVTGNFCSVRDSDAVTGSDPNSGNPLFDEGSAFTAQPTGTCQAVAFAGSGAFSDEVQIAPLQSSSPVIQPSGYFATVVGTLNPTDYNASASPFTLGGNNIGLQSGQLQTLFRQGSQIIVPWVTSATTVASNGGATNSNMIRVAFDGPASAAANGSTSSESTQIAIVLGEVVSSTSGAFPNGQSVFLGVVAPGRELMLSSQDLQNSLGDFGRGDIRLTVEAQPDQVTVKRLVTNGTGTFTETSLGTLQNPSATAQQPAGAPQVSPATPTS